MKRTEGTRDDVESPGDPGAELRAALVAQLDLHRAHVLAGIEGLGEGELDRVVAPSGWTMRGLVTHLLHDVELFWMGAVLGADRSAIARVCDGWSAPSVPGDQLRAQYRAAAASGNRHLRGVDLDAKPRWWPTTDVFEGPRLGSGLAVVLRVLGETATHAGHIDMARERIDGHQHLVVT
ncbi:MAG: DUF664 domain-containing protein [Nocardioides sp.]